ncbi:MULTISPECIES: hypothetical protein [Amycolatopsis]|uniref:Uncharacterized protein n=2 Tax=Amycolatopsis TaxID=1813 RepID=A0A1I3TNV4_9PSEU|nr:hypothetical protein [Amycolatopsis sacchari]SFJ72908.1 hypothetical protein SAMN05421835_1086 [Amycolatopsis sacchari]
MNEQELGHALRVAVRDEPPLAIDPDRLIAHAKRTAKRRRATWATGAAVVAVATTAVIVAPGHDEEPALPVADSPKATVTVTQPAPASRVPNRREQELVDYERTHAPQVLTGVRVESVTGMGGVEGDPVLGIRVKVEGHENPLELVISAPTHSEGVDSACARWQCYNRQTLADGSVTVFAKWEMGLSAAHFRTDGSLVEVNRWNDDATEWAGVPESAFLQLATDPNLSF